MTSRHLGPVIGGCILAVTLAACGSTAPATPAASSTTPNATQPTAASSSGATPTTSSASAPAPAVTESNPPGDIPDNQAYVAYVSPARLYTVQVPEGWARTTSGASTTFSDKLNSITVAESSTSTAPTIASATAVQVPALASTVTKFQLQKVTGFTRAGGNGVLITYQADSPANPVTGKVVRDAVESFLFWRNGKLVTLSLIGPQSADNVDPWAKVSGSFRWVA